MKTEVLNWKEEYSVGLETVDIQHKKFLAIINELGDCIADKTFKEKGHHLFFALINFANVYLLKEKMLVNSLNELDYSFFRGKHIAFLKHLQDFQLKYEKQSTEQVFFDLYNYLKKMYPEFLAYYTPSLVAILKENGIN
ncbi:MAG: hypothetical protein JEZ09_17515 [Salinivirgaceae bacterium]|nr:hypothetical protein [Salinivirgaceae bacterium]